MRASLRPALPARPAAGGAAKRPAARVVVRARAMIGDEEKQSPSMALRQGVAALLAGLFVTAAAPFDAEALSVRDQKKRSEREVKLFLR